MVVRPPAIVPIKDDQQTEKIPRNLIAKAPTIVGPVPPETAALAPNRPFVRETAMTKDLRHALDSAEAATTIRDFPEVIAVVASLHFEKDPVTEMKDLHQDLA